MTEDETKALERVYAKMIDRVVVDSLCRKLPPLAELKNVNDTLVTLLRDVYVILVQRNELTLIVDEEGKNKFGQTQDEALDQINEVLSAVARTVARVGA